MRRGFGFLWVALTSILLAVVGVIAYQAGWAAGAATLPAGAAAAAPYYYYGPHFIGFGLFGFFWFLFILFVLFWLFRAIAFGRGWGHGGWGYRRWGGYYGGQGGGVPPAIDERMQEWHRRAHGEPAPTPPPPDTKTV